MTNEDEGCQENCGGNMVCYLCTHQIYVTAVASCRTLRFSCGRRSAFKLIGTGYLRKMLSRRTAARLCWIGAFTNQVCLHALRFHSIMTARTTKTFPKLRVRFEPKSANFFLFQVIR